ncbi:MAG: hypothetical protein LBN03_01585, partial [Bifidobacteriaceae bacterium]|nr:hypothetical protein [Bifidobacteriaceae bacterium]
MAVKKKPINKIWLWVSIASFLILGGILLSAVLNPAPKKVTTKDGLDLLHDNKVQKVEVTDNIQRTVLELKDDFSKDDKNLGKKVFFLYIDQEGDEVLKSIHESDIPDGFDEIVPTQSYLMNLIGAIVPFLIVLILFYFIMAKSGG